MSALAWGTDIGYAGSPASQRPHLVVLPGGATQAGATGGLRFTRRGRLALAALVVVLAVVLGFVGLRGAGAAEPPHVVTVGAGQTLSEIAATQLPDHSISAGIVAIQLENGLSTAQVSVGQQLAIPED